MANSNSLFTVALVGGAAYLLYNWWTSQPAATTTTGGGTTGGGTTGGGTTGGGTPTPPATPATTQYTGAADLLANGIALTIKLAQMTATPSSPPQLNIDQWNYYYAQIPDATPITGDQLNAMLAKAGATGANRSYVLMSPGQYVGLLQSSGVPGLSGYLRNGGFGYYGLADLRRAGRR